MDDSNRLHKQRQRARTQAAKQNSLDDLLDRVPSPLDAASPLKTSLADLYQPIPALSIDHDFWSHVPNICNPNAAILNNEIADERKLAILKYQEEKYRRKLEKKTKNGFITEEERKILWEKHGRSGTTEEQGMTLLSAQRGQRKVWQVENFVSLLSDKLTPGSTVVDFGCGSGNLCLALAAYFVDVRFVLVDKKPYSLKLAKRRADDAGLKNVEVLEYTFTPENLENFVATIGENDDASDTTLQRCGSFDIGIGLHSCGSFTDMVMELCRDRGADCIVCPCCNGAMTSKTTCGYAYPRSTFLRNHINQEEYLGQLSKSADDLGNYPAKCLIEYDRAMWAKENGFREVELWKLTPVECTPKHHVLYLKK
jgi:SAM-dependent methyltransferase